MRRLFMLAALSLRAQSVLTPDLEALAKIRTRMIYNLRHQPNYTCVETIERLTRPRSSKQFKVVDTIRLEVALVDGREMFAWPGSKKFADDDVTSMVTTGAIGNGNFANHARTLFEMRAANFHYVGPVEWEGRKSIRFDYDVPQMVSSYRIRVSKAAAIVGYHGSFYADPQTFDMQRIEVIAEQIPPALMLLKTSDKIDYAMTRIGEGDFLLPSQSELSMSGLAGGAEQNRVKFTSCRQYSGESVISFGDPPASEEPAASSPGPAREFELPKGVDLELSLLAAIDLEKAAIGDPVRARVDRDVKKDGRILIPKGAIASGRITRLERNEKYSLVGLEFPEIEAPGILARMKGDVTNTVGVGPVSQRISIHGRSAKQPGEGLIPVNQTQLRLPKGCIMFWRT